MILKDSTVFYAPAYGQSDDCARCGEMRCVHPGESCWGPWRESCREFDPPMRFRHETVNLCLIAFAWPFLAAWELTGLFL